MRSSGCCVTGSWACTRPRQARSSPAGPAGGRGPGHARRVRRPEGLRIADAGREELRTRGESLTARGGPSHVGQQRRPPRSRRASGGPFTPPRAADLGGPWVPARPAGTSPPSIRAGGRSIGRGPRAGPARARAPPRAGLTGGTTPARSGRGAAGPGRAGGRRGRAATRRGRAGGPEGPSGGWVSSRRGGPVAKPSGPATGPGCCRVARRARQAPVPFRRAGLGRRAARAGARAPSTDWPGRRGWEGGADADPEPRPGWTGPLDFSTLRDLERLAVQFTSDLRKLATQSSAVGENVISDLRTILEDALERIKSEIFGAGHEPSAGDTDEETRQD